MNAILEQPAVPVLESEYKRLLGLPPRFVMEDRVAELAAWARGWYEEHGRPWVYSREADSLEIEEGTVRVEGVPFASKVLTERLAQGKAHGCVLVAVGAGAEPEEEARERWMVEHPDEYFFLEMYASAVVEHLIMEQGSKICARADDRGWTVLPHYSPGYTGWAIEDQRALFRLVTAKGSTAVSEKVEILSSGMLLPRKSQLALFGLTEKGNARGPSVDSIPCESCAFDPCQFRRTPYKWKIYEEGMDRGNEGPNDVASIPKPPPLRKNAEYAFGENVLARWARDRLRLEERDDGNTVGRFLYEGSTCNNAGYPILINYEVRLGPESEGFRILEMSCQPAADDAGFARMCATMNRPRIIETALREETPMVGEPLEEILEWNPESLSSGCLCNPADRNHKWRIVLQTLHYGMAHNEK